MKIEKTECNYQVTECDLKFGEQITLGDELLISVSALDKVRAKINEAYERSFGVYNSAYRDGLDKANNIINKYITARYSHDGKNNRKAV